MCSVNPMAGKAPILLYVVHGRSHTTPQSILVRVLIFLNQCSTLGRVARFPRDMLHNSQKRCVALLRPEPLFWRTAGLQGGGGGCQD